MFFASSRRKKTTAYYYAIFQQRNTVHNVNQTFFISKTALAQLRPQIQGCFIVIVIIVMMTYMYLVNR